jgi:hypothetical protein
MGRKIFISYKYNDAGVRTLAGNFDTRARHYVDAIQAHLDKEDHVNKGEKDGEDLSNFADETIASKLRDRIYDSSITLVVMSKNMKDWTAESEQWIPWEISYSLKEHSRDGRTSATNAVLAVALPDEFGSYNHFVVENTCSCGSKTIQTGRFFEIIRDNMFNRKTPNQSNCNQHGFGNAPHIGDDHSYIYAVKWEDFISDVNGYLDKAVEMNNNITDFSITKM